MNHIRLKAGTGLQSSGRAVHEAAIWLNSAKGGDPMSHGSAEGSALRIAEHYR
jgi:hypothetical protein